MKKGIWYVDFPTYRYVESVKQLAITHNLEIVDSRFQGTNSQCENPPKLTLVGGGVTTKRR